MLWALTPSPARSPLSKSGLWSFQHPLLLEGAPGMPEPSAEAKWIEQQLVALHTSGLTMILGQLSGRGQKAANPIPTLH